MESWCKAKNNEDETEDASSPINLGTQHAMSSDSLYFGGASSISNTPNTIVEMLNNTHQDPCNAQTGWMDFLQVLVHQHAKTIVTLQDLTVEVEKLKDFRSSFINSIQINSDLTKPPGPSHSHHLHHHHKQDVWTSSPNNNKLIDSGFSTETKESSKKDDEDPLYSLLDLIQTKVSNSSSNSTATTCTCKAVNNGTKTSASQLGKLDQLLGFNNDLDNVILDRNVIRAILRETDSVEFQRQILFGAAKVKTLESRLSGLSSGENNASRLGSKYLALSQENEQLRFKLKEQEIQLEGTKAKLRILEKNNNASNGANTSGESRENEISELTSKINNIKISNTNIASSSSNGYQQFDGGTRNHHVLLNSTEISHKISQSQQQPGSSSSCNNIIATAAAISNIENRIKKGNSFMKFSPSSSPTVKGKNYTNDYNHISSSNSIPTIGEEEILNDILSRRKSQSDIDIDPNNTNLNFHICSNNNMNSNDKTLNTNHNNISSCYINNYENNSSSSPPEAASNDPVQASAAANHHNHNLTPPLRKNRSSSVHSRIPTRPQTPRKSLSSSTLSSTPPQPLSKSSPISSISSKSSIPIAVTRLKRNNVNIGKKQGTNFWSQWFS